MAEININSSFTGIGECISPDIEASPGINEVVKKWRNTERSISLTNSEWNDLAMYILMTAQYREEAIRMWLDMSVETNPDGTPKYRNAASNAKAWKKIAATVDKVRRVIDKTDE